MAADCGDARSGMRKVCGVVSTWEGTVAVAYGVFEGPGVLVGVGVLVGEREAEDRVSAEALTPEFAPSTRLPAKIIAIVNTTINDPARIRLKLFLSAV